MVSWRAEACSWNMEGRATRAANNSLRACDKLTPQKERRGWLEEALREAADLDRWGQRRLVPSHSAHPATKSGENSRTTGLGQQGEPGEAGRSAAWRLHIFTRRALGKLTPQPHIRAPHFRACWSQSGPQVS